MSRDNTAGGPRPRRYTAQDAELLLTLTLALERQAVTMGALRNERDALSQTVEDLSAQVDTLTVANTELLDAAQERDTPSRLRMRLRCV